MALSRSGRVRISIEGDTSDLSRATSAANRELSGLKKGSMAGSAALRAGSVPAMKLYWEMLLDDAVEPPADDSLARLDELAEAGRRRARGLSG